MIEAIGLTKQYGSTMAVDDLSFTVDAGNRHRVSRARTEPANRRRCG